MQKSSDVLLGILLIAVSWGYLTLSHAEQNPKEAVLTDISVILADLETELKRRESYSMVIPKGIPLAEVLQHLKTTALVAKSTDPPLIPDIHKKADGIWLGGCPVDDTQWSLIRMDYAALTRIPDRLAGDSIKLCLDRNGPAGPNRDGYDVVWLQLNRTGSPHITLIPSTATGS